MEHWASPSLLTLAAASVSESLGPDSQAAKPLVVSCVINSPFFQTSSPLWFLHLWLDWLWFSSEHLQLHSAATRGHHWGQGSLRQLDEQHTRWWGTLGHGVGLHLLHQHWYELLECVPLSCLFTVPRTGAFMCGTVCTNLTEEGAAVLAI